MFPAETLIAELALEYQVFPETICSDSHHPRAVRARRLAAWVLAQDFELSRQVIAELLEVSPGSVTRLVAGADLLARTDPGFQSELYRWRMWTMAEWRELDEVAS